MKRSSLLAALAAAVLIPPSPLRAEDSPDRLMVVESVSGASFSGALVGFDGKTAVFRRPENGKPAAVDCDKLSRRSLGHLALRLPARPFAIEPGTAAKCTPWLNEDELRKILELGYELPRMHEKLAVLQLFAMGRRMVDSQILLAQIDAGLPAKLKEVEAIEIKARDWLKINPLTGRPSAPLNYESDMKKARLLRQEALRSFALARENFLIRLSAARTYAVHCEKAGHAGMSEAILAMRKKVLERSVIGREMEEAAGVILGWLAARVAVHHYEGGNEAFLVRPFGKALLDSQVDDAFATLLIDSTPETRTAVKGALIAVTEGRLTLEDTGGDAIGEALVQAAKGALPGTEVPRNELEFMRPFLDEAVRMGGR